MDFKWDVIVTRHPALSQLLQERGIVDGSIPIISHANEKDISGKNVLGILPLNLACKANLVGEVELALTPEMRGRELDLAILRQIARELKIYKVQEIK